jgi:hypothetical protein
MTKHLVIFLWLAISQAVWAQELGKVPSIPIIQGAQIEFRPSMDGLIAALQNSGLSHVETVVAVAYNEKGEILGVRLEKPTGSRELDLAIQAWTAQIRLTFRESGYASLPFTFKLSSW